MGVAEEGMDVQEEAAQKPNRVHTQMPKQ